MKNLMTLIKTSISEVLETMFYLPVEFREKLSPEKIGSIKKEIKIGCSLKVSGSFSAIFQLFIPDPLLLNMTQNFMGEDPENCTEEYLNGTLKESLNMIIGNALKNIDTKTPPDLDIPEIIDISCLGTDSLIAIETIDGTMIMEIKLN
ncbi:MAG: chemotaxis protein CheX [Desulfobacterales bacterium]|nr:chemotaxis protein CheX [Desulfobacterales bacterium]